MLFLRNGQLAIVIYKVLKSSFADTSLEIRLVDMLRINHTLRVYINVGHLSVWVSIDVIFEVIIFLLDFLHNIFKDFVNFLEVYVF